jgi:hypothetical protein
MNIGTFQYLNKYLFKKKRYNNTPRTLEYDIITRFKTLKIKKGKIWCDPSDPIKNPVASCNPLTFVFLFLLK